MGKSDKGKNKSAGYVHQHNHNPKAKNSDERRLELVKTIQVSRLSKLVDRQKELLADYIPAEKRKLNEKKPDPRYLLKGAAIPAQEFYRPPGYEAPTIAIDLLTQLGDGHLWEHEEGRVLLQLLRDLGLALNNVGHKTRQAIATFSEMLQYDKDDNLRARHHLLRCHLDRGDALNARTLLDSYTSDTHCCWLFARALIEFISLSLLESGASETTCDNALLAAHNANRFAIFTLAYADSFEAALQALEQITLPAAGSLEDALQFFDADIALWRDTDGALEWVRNTTSRLQLMPPTRAEATAAISSTSSLDHHFTTYVQSTESSSSVTRGQVDAHAMFVGMYFTALEMAHE